MSLRVAVQMDPLESLNLAGDSTFALMRGAARRGHTLFSYRAGDLAWRDGRVTASARAVSIAGDGDPELAARPWAYAGEAEVLDLGADIDVVLMRQDPPFDIAYITATHLLEHAQRAGTLVVNDPAAVRNAPEKLFVLDYAALMPPTLITRSLDDARAFQRQHGAVVVKPLHGNGGAAVFRMNADDPNLSALVELFGQVWREPFMVQAFLPAVAEGDKRIVLVDGRVAGAVNRVPAAGQIRSNLAVGGRGEKTVLSAADHAICEAIGPELKARGLLFVGIDVIAGKLTEINVTSPTGIVAIDRFDGTDTPARIWDAIEAKVAPRVKP